ncbi:MAG: hypothetical protein SW833_08595 [Cyanobacteriota bacterium]|nr:hypothetical protein [Cyanobacteriota bacterium]
MEIAAAREFVRDRFSGVELSEGEIENQLLEQFRKDIIEQDGSFYPESAEVCLRCWVSGRVEQTCIQLELHFGKSEDFTRYDRRVSRKLSTARVLDRDRGGYGIVDRENF